MKLLVVEDDRGIRQYVKKGLEAEAFVIDAVPSGEEALKCFERSSYDAVILDLSLEGKLTGLQVASHIRKENASIPIIILTGVGELDMKLTLLKVCDDYMTKPFSIEELIARIRAVLRRGNVTKSDTLKVGGLVMDVANFSVTKEGKEIMLRNKEFALLEYFMRNPGKVLSRSKILEHVWDMNADPFTNTVDVHVRLLRTKLDDTDTKNIIRTIVGRGYQFNAS